MMGFSITVTKLYIYRIQPSQTPRKHSRPCLKSPLLGEGYFLASRRVNRRVDLKSAPFLGARILTCLVQIGLACLELCAQMTIKAKFEALEEDQISGVVSEVLGLLRSEAKVI